MGAPNISIIIPVYNAEHYLASCIESVICQTYTNWELLLINDGSKDDSLSICQSYCEKDSRISVYSKMNSGVSDTRNFGIEKSRGEWVCFIDSDDTVEVDYLLKLVKGTNPQNDNQFALCGYRNVYINKENDSDTHTFAQDYNSVGIVEALCMAERNNIINSPVCKLFKKNIIIDNKLRFDRTINYGEDHLFVLEYCLFVNRAFISNYVGYNYFHRGNDSLTSTNANTGKFVVYVEILDQAYDDVLKVLDDDKLRSVLNNRLFEHIVRALYFLIDSNETYANKHLKFHSLYVINKKCTCITPESFFYKTIHLALALPEKMSYLLVVFLCGLKTILRKK